MATCPRGHESATTDYGDQCGTPIAPAAPAVPSAPVDGQGEPDLSSATQVRRVEPTGEPCPVCGTPRQPDDRYCEVDGYDFEDAAPIAFLWQVTIEPDRARFDALRPDDLQFPDGMARWTCSLDGESVSVGRRSPSRGIYPDIDLSGAHEDPGVSRQHLRFDRQPDGSYAVVDCGSANGTTVNDARERITPHTAVPLADGDRVHLGAWTKIMIVRQPAGASTG